MGTVISYLRVIFYWEGTYKDPVYIIFVLLFSALTALYVISKLLCRSNSLGEDITNFNNYGSDIDYYANVDRTDTKRLGLFATTYYRSPWGDDDDVSAAPDPNDDIYGDLPEVDKPLFAPPPGSDPS